MIKGEGMKDKGYTACKVYSTHMTRALIFACQKGIIERTRGTKRSVHKHIFWMLTSGKDKSDHK